VFKLGDVLDIVGDWESESESEPGGVGVVCCKRKQSARAV